MTIRSFIAIPLPTEAANLLGDYSAKMAYQDKTNAVRWVDQENYHITLAFLGDQQEADLEQLVDALDQHVQQCEFTVGLTQVAPFPESRPKLIAAMVDKNDDLMALHNDVQAALRDTGIRSDKRKFAPHITLGRFRHSRNPYAGRLALLEPFTVLLEECVLYESILGSNGAHYEPLTRLPLELINFDDVYADEV